MSWTLVGQDAAVAVLKSAVDERPRRPRLPLRRAERTSARPSRRLQFAQLLNCTGAEPPCGRCRACERIAARPASGRGDDRDRRHVRRERAQAHARTTRATSASARCAASQHLVSRAPYEARYRVIIIEPADSARTRGDRERAAEDAGGTAAIRRDHPDHRPRGDAAPTRSARAPGAWPSAGAPQRSIEQTLRTRWDVEPHARGGAGAALGRPPGLGGGGAVRRADDGAASRRRSTRRRRWPQRRWPSASPSPASLGGGYTQAIAPACRRRWRCGRSGGATSC